MSSAIDPSKPTEGTATTASVRDNFAAAKTEIETLQGLVQDAQDTADAAAAAAVSAASAWVAAYPIGCIFVSILATNPNTLLGFGTWAAFGAGRVPVGQDTGNVAFDVLEETGGEQDHTLTTSEIPSHTHTQNAHTHTQNAHTHTQNAHSHNFPVRSGAVVASADAVSRTGATLTSLPTADATAVNQNTTAVNQNATATNNNEGGSGSHNNLQPYIVVKMWKRTA